MERIPLPDDLAQRVAEFAAAGVPAVPRLAATVLLLRPVAGDFEVFVQRRAATMAFAAGAWAFPGGSVDPSDSLASASVGWVGPSPLEWAQRLGLETTAAEGVLCAAVRELYEESGVLLAGATASPHPTVADLHGPEWEAGRADLAARRVHLAAWLAAQGLIPRTDLLVPWARWLTPDFEPRRFDTFFFLARLPAGQSPRQAGGEADHVAWLPPAEAVRLPMLPPTRFILGELAHFENLDDLFGAATARDFTAPVHPVIEVDETGTWLRV